MIIECPKCGSDCFDCNDMETNPAIGVHWEYCYCEECGAEFEVKYVAVEIEYTGD